ncbi:MAG: protein SCO1/2 [Rhodothermales bacterium]|jgi:protein SCO1/2
MKTRSRLNPLAKAAIAGIVVGLFAALSLAPSNAIDPNPQLESATVFYNQSRALPAFSLQDHHATAFSPERLSGRWSVVFLGYTHCPDVCPVTLGHLRTMKGMLPDALRDELDVVFVSVDPERDSLDHLKKYVTFFDEKFLGVTGSPQELGLLAKGISGLFHVDEHEPGNKTYLVDHSSHIAIINPLGRFHGIFSYPHEPEVMAREFQTIVAAHNGDS